MDKLTEKIPQHCRSEWDAIANFNFAANYSSMEEVKVEVQEFKGHRLQPTFPAQGIAYAYDNWTPRKGDVLIASFPRTGTNWTSEITRQILFIHDEEQMEMSKNIPLLLMLYEGGGTSKFKILNHLPMRGFQATHLPASLINVDNILKAEAKIICVVRNPKDQAHSWYNFASKLPYMHMEPKTKEIVTSQWPEFLESYISGKMPIGMKDGEWYLHHLLSWYKYKDQKNVLFLCFEDMKRDLPKEVRRMASFLDINLTEEQVQKVAENCGFAKMKISTDEGRSAAEQTRKDIKVMNKGQVGNWKEHFTVAQSEAIDDQVKKVLGNTDIKFTYEL